MMCTPAWFAIWAGLSMCVPQFATAQSATPFVAPEFSVPEGLANAEFRLRMLTVNDVVKDYDAVMSSVGHLRTIFGPGSSWPEGLTLEQNLVDLGWHQKEFQRRRSFAYTVVDPSGERVLGCVYVNPTAKRGFDAAVYLWARQSELEKGLEHRLYEAVQDWVRREWPFRNAAFPGRTIGWDAWNSTPNEKR